MIFLPLLLKLHPQKSRVLCGVRLGKQFSLVLSFDSRKESSGASIDCTKPSYDEKCK